MGQQFSKDIRSRLEHQTLEELLINDKCAEEIEQHLLRLPKTSHNNLAKILASWDKAISNNSISKSQSNKPPQDWIPTAKNRNSRSYKLGSLWSIQSQDINIPQKVAEVLKQNPRDVLRQWSKNGVDLQSPSDYYEYTCNVETDRILCRILWRFLTTFYYDLISELDATKNLLHKTENGGVSFVVAVICQSGKHNCDIVRERVVGWAKIGRRYRGFMNALCSGCLFLFPEKISDLVWETYVPVKGSTFAKVTQFLRELGIVCKCEEGGWNDLSDQILQALREPFRNVIPFQFQPDQQSQLRYPSNQPFASAPGDVDVNRREPGPLPKQGANRVIKATRKRGTASVRRKLQSVTGDLAPLQAPRAQNRAHGGDPQRQLPRAPAQFSTPAPNECGQWHLTTNDQIQQPVNIPLKTTEVHNVDEQQGQVESSSDTSRFGRSGINNISSLLNHDSGTSIIGFPVAQNSLPGSPTSLAEPDGVTTGS
ncbi:hypothetical protein X797_012100 [Metarhizium robertsii]|uniref:Kinesin light chain n=2 Tax=Metarhizium robertsii TaxID=568076 RepID=A0A0B2X7S3_METRA